MYWRIQWCLPHHEKKVYIADKYVIEAQKVQKEGIEVQEKSLLSTTISREKLIDQFSFLYFLSECQKSQEYVIWCKISY